MIRPRAALRLVLAAVLSALIACEAAPPSIEATTALAETGDTRGPYQVDAVVTGLVGGDTVELFHAAGEDAPFTAQVMTGDDSGERFVAAIPGQPAGTAIRYFVAVQRDGQRLDSDPPAAEDGPYSFVIAAP
ncbi:MAG: hypothetical protein AAGC55_33530 [Myxococcota bacterium]